MVEVLWLRRDTFDYETELVAYRICEYEPASDAIKTATPLDVVIQPPLVHCSQRKQERAEACRTPWACLEAEPMSAGRQNCGKQNDMQDASLESGYDS